MGKNLSFLYLRKNTLKIIFSSSQCGAWGTLRNYSHVEIITLKANANKITRFIDIQAISVYIPETALNTISKYNISSKIVGLQQHSPPQTSSRHSIGLKLGIQTNEGPTMYFLGKILY